MEGFVREAVGVFDTQEELDAAFVELEKEFPRMDMSVLGSTKEAEKQTGFQMQGVEWLEDHPNAPRQVSVRPEEKVIGSTILVGSCAYIFGCIGAVLASSGTTVFILLSVTLGSLIGGTLGLLVLWFMHNRAQRELQRQMKRGGLLLWVRTMDAERERLAQQILRTHGARDVHVHSIA